MSIRGKLIGLILCIAFLPVLVIGYIYFSNFKKVSERHTLNNLEIFAEYKQEKLKLYLAELHTRALDFASDGFLRDSLERFQRVENRATIIAGARNHLVANKQNIDDRVLSIDLINRDGEVVVSTDNTRVGQRTAAISRLVDKQAGIYITDVIPSGTPGQAVIEMYSVVNSRTDNDKRIGYLAIRFDAGMLDLLMTSQWLMPMLRGERGGGLGESEEIYLVNGAGMMINHARHGDKATRAIPMTTDPVARCLSEGESMTGRWRNYRGVEVIGAARCMQMAGFRWVLLAEISQAEAFALISDYRRFFSLVLLTTLLLILVVTIFVTRVISRPISALNQGVKKVALGDLNYGVGTDKRDEIGELSRAFDRMVSAFRCSRGEIEGANQNLRRANDELNFMRTAMDQHAIIVETDVSGVITRVNAKFCQISQYSQRELIGRTHRMVNSGRHDKTFFCRLWSTISGGRVWHGDICNRRKDGSLYWVRTTVVPHLDVNGTVDRYIALRTDITHQKQVEEKLLRSNRALLASTQIQKALTKAMDERQLLDKVCRLLIDQGGYRFAWVGYARHDAGKSVQPMAQAGHAAGYLDNVSVSWAEDTTGGRGPAGKAIRLGREVIVRDVGSDAGFVPWRDAALQRGYQSVIALPLAQGARTLGVLVIYAAGRDAFVGDEVDLLKLLADDIAYGITGLRIRSERDSTQAALRESEINLKRAQQIARLGSWEWDLGSDKMGWSDELFRLLGYEPGAVTPSLKILLATICREQREMVEQQIRGCTRDGQPCSLSFSICLPDGELRHVSAQWVVYSGGEDGATRIAGTLMDITEQKHSERERESLQNQLQHAQKLHSIGQLTGGVAHDFNNILSSIMGYTALAIEECPVSDAEYLSYLDEVSKAGARAKELIAQLTTFSRRDNHEIEVVDIETLVHDVYRMIRTALPAAIEFKLELEAELPPVHANQVKLHQVITNLVINARDAIEGFGEVVLLARRRELRGCLCTSCQQRFSGDYIELRVSDSGKGIADAHLVTIFEPFFTTKAIGKGTGMGLSMVHGLVHSHHGHVQVESAPGEGSRFAVYLPVYRASGAPGENDAAPPQPAPAARPANAGGTLLLVDDERAITQMLAELLGRYGYRCVQAHSAAQALQHLLADADGVDLVITDHMMPEMTGLALARRLSVTQPQLPVVLCTGFSGELDGQALREAGIRDILEKPIDVKRLLAVIGDKLQPPDRRAPA